PPVRVVAQLRGQPGRNSLDRLAYRATAPFDVGVEPRAARIADVLLALRDFEHRLRQLADCAEEVDLEDADVLMVAFEVEHILQRRVGDEAAVPIELAVDLDRW